MTARRTTTKGAGDPMAALLALSGAIAVIAGAYGTHGASGKAAEWLATGAHYALLHALAGIVAAKTAGGKGGRAIAALFLIGSAVFAGTLYAMALGGPKILGAVTPLGGLALILGWMWWAVTLLRGR